MSDIALIGLASVYLWFLLAHASITAPVFGWVRDRGGWVGELVNCPWCAGFWISGVVTVATGYDFLAHLAAAAVVGIIGGYVE